MITHAKRESDSPSQLLQDSVYMYKFKWRPQIFIIFTKRTVKETWRKIDLQNISEDATLPVSQQQSRYKATCGQIRYVMKRSNDALSNKLKDGRPCKFCKRCGVELRAVKPCRRKAREEPVKQKQRKMTTNYKKKKKQSDYIHRNIARSQYIKEQRHKFYSFFTWPP